MYVHIFGYLVNKLEIWWVYLSPIEKKNKGLYINLNTYYNQVTTPGSDIPLLHV